MAIDVVERTEDLVIELGGADRVSLLIDENSAGKPAWPRSRTALVWLIPFAAFVAGATLWAVDHIEDDLEDATIAQIREDYGVDIGRENVDFDYRDGEVNFIRPAGVEASDVERQLESRIDGAGSGDAIREGDINNLTVLGEAAPPATTAAPATTTTAASATTSPPTTAAAAPATGPLDVSVETDGATITLAGTVLSEQQRATLVDAATAAVGAENVVDELTVSGLDEAEAGSDAKVADLASLFQGFGSLESGSGTLSDTALDFSGIAPDAESGATVSDLAGSANDETNVVINVAELGVDEQVELLQAEIDALQEEVLENVVFAPASDVLLDQAAGTLDKVAAAMTRYQRPVVLVAGHTDSDGTDAYNLDLSDRRARAVSAYLVDQGIALERLQGRGFGEAEPVAPNDSDANKQRNRRVEFTASGEFADTDS